MEERCGARELKACAVEAEDNREEKKSRYDAQYQVMATEHR